MASITAREPSLLKGAILRTALLAWLLLHSASLLAIGAWQLVPSLSQVHADRLAAKMLDRENLTSGELIQLQRARAAGSAVWPSSRWLTELAVARLHGSAMRPPLQPGDLEAALRALDRAISLNPTNSHAWAALAYALGRKQGMGAASAVEAWRMSILTDPAEPRLLLWRSEIGLGGTAALTADDMKLLEQQLRLAWRREGQAVLDLAREYSAVSVLERALAESPEDLAQLKSLL